MGGGGSQVDLKRLLREVPDADVERVKRQQFEVLNQAAKHAIAPLFAGGRQLDATDPKWRTYVTVMEGLRHSSGPLTDEQLDRARRTLEAL